MSTTLKSLHDRMLAEQPEDALHVASTCPLCTPSVETASANLNGGLVAEPKTYTQEEHDALAAVVSALQAQVAELTAAGESSAMDAKIAAAVAQVEAQVTELQSQLDAAVLEAQAAKDERDTTIAYLTGERDAAEAASALSARRDERIAKVKEAASFPDEYLESNADRFAAMSDEDFEKALEDWKVIAPAPKPASSVIPAATAMTAARSTDTPSVLAEVLNLRFQGIDVRNVH